MNFSISYRYLRIWANCLLSILLFIWIDFCPSAVHSEIRFLALRPFCRSSHNPSYQLPCLIRITRTEQCFIFFRYVYCINTHGKILNCQELRLSECFHSKCPFLRGLQFFRLKFYIFGADPMQDVFNYLRKLLIFQVKIIYLANIIQSLFNRNRKYFHSLSPFLPILTWRKLPIELRFLVLLCLEFCLFHGEGGTGTKELARKLCRLTQDRG